MLRKLPRVKIRIDDIPNAPGYDRLTVKQILAIEQLAKGNSVPFYRETSWISRLLIRMQISHDLSRDKWAKGMYKYWSGVLEILEAYRKLLTTIYNK